MAHKLLYNIYKWEKLYTIYEPLQLTVPRSLSFFHLLVSLFVLAGNNIISRQRGRGQLLENVRSRNLIALISR